MQVNTLPARHASTASPERSPRRPRSSSRFTDDEGRNFLDRGAGRCRRPPRARGPSGPRAAPRRANSPWRASTACSWVGGLVLLAGFGVASWLLATVALRPVAAMRRQCRATDRSDGHPPGAAQPATSSPISPPPSISFLGTSASVERAGEADGLRRGTRVAHSRWPRSRPNSNSGTATRGTRWRSSAICAPPRTSVDRLASLAANLLELSRLESHESGTTVSIRRRGSSTSSPAVSTVPARSSVRQRASPSTSPWSTSMTSTASYAHRQRRPSGASSTTCSRNALNALDRSGAPSRRHSRSPTEI